MQNHDRKEAKSLHPLHAGRYIGHGAGIETFIDWALDCLFMVLFLVLVIMTTLAYGL